MCIKLVPIILNTQGGGNIVEVIIFGRIAGENADKEKEYVSSVLSAKEQNVVYVPGYETDLKVADYSDVVLNENEYLGIGTGSMGDDIAIKTKIIEGKIQTTEVVAQNETPVVLQK